MARYFSDHFTATGVTQTALQVPGTVTASGVNHGRIYYKRAQLTVLGLNSTTDELRFFSLNSGDRLLELWLSSDGAAGAGAVDVGLYESGRDHTGTVVDANMFATAIDISSGLDRDEVLLEAEVLQHESHGIMMWEAVNVFSSATYAVDPLINFDVTCNVTTDFTTTAPVLVLEAYYTSSGG